MTHSVTPLAASWRYRRGKCRQPCMGSKKKRKNHSGRLCPLFKQCHRGEGRVVGGGEGLRRGGTSGREDKREEVSHSCPAWGPKIRGAFLVTASPASRSSPVIILPLAEHTRRLSGTHMHSSTTTTHCLCPPWSTLKCCQHQILKHGQL